MWASTWRPFNFTNWYPREPTGGSDDCLETGKDFKGKVEWSSVFCIIKIYLQTRVSEIKLNKITLAWHKEKKKKITSLTTLTIVVFIILLILFLYNYFCNKNTISIVSFNLSQKYYSPVNSTHDYSPGGELHFNHMSFFV